MRNLPCSTIAIVALGVAAPLRAAPDHDRLGVPLKLAPGMVEYASGLDELAAARFGSAVAELDKAIALDPGSAAFRRARALALLCLERVPDGLEEASRAYDLDRRDDGGRQVFALGLRMKGDLAKAMAVFVPKGRDPYQKLFLDIGNQYAELVMAQGVDENYVRQVRAKVDEARAKLPVLARLFADRERQGSDVGKALFRRGYDLFHAGKFAKAEPQLAAAAARWPTDATILAYHAAAESNSGRREQGRRRMSTALCWLPALPSGYQQRGIGAARQGAIERARADLAILRELQPGDPQGWADRLEKEIGAAERSMPTATPAALLAQLIALARNGAADEQLVEKARSVLMASNRTRRLGDETYQEKRRHLTWLLRAEPGNADRMAALADFLIDEVDVRGERVEPAGYGTAPYRERNKALQDKELAEARALCDAALRVRPGHAAANLGLAKLAARGLRWHDAQVYLERALQADPTLPGALDLMSRVMKAAADQKAAAAFALRTPERWSEVVGRWRYHYVRYPSAAELRLANQYDAQSAQFLQKGLAYIRKAIAACAGRAEGDSLVGSLAWRTGDYEGAYRAWSAAVSKQPENREYRYSLANACGKLGRVDEWLEHTSHGRNLEHTTASAHLWHAWDRIMARDWDAAGRTLQQAAAVDAADPRVACYLGIVAEGQGRTQEAIAFHRAALALCAAHQWNRGVTETGALDVDEVARAMGIRLRLGALVARSDPAAAARIFLQNVALEERIGDFAFPAEAAPALLPDVRPGATEVPLTPIAGALLRESRARAAIALSDAGQHEEAIRHFRMLNGYRARTANAQANLDGADPLSVSPPTWLAAIRSLEATGNRAHAWAWLMQARRYFEGSAAGQGDILRAEYDACKGRLPKPAGVRDQTYSQMGSDVFREALVSQPSQSIDARRQQAHSFARKVEQEYQRIARLPSGERSAARERLERYVAANGPAPLPGPAGGARTRR